MILVPTRHCLSSHSFDRHQEAGRHDTPSHLCSIPCHPRPPRLCDTDACSQESACGTWPTGELRRESSFIFDRLLEPDSDLGHDVYHPRRTSGAGFDRREPRPRALARVYHQYLYRYVVFPVSNSFTDVSSADPTSTSAVPPTSALATTASATSSDPNPITAFLSSPADNGFDLPLSLGLGGATSSAIPSSTSSSSSPVVTGTTGNSTKHVFAHFMVGIVSTYAQSDWQADMSLAKSKGLTGFALNIGVDSCTQAQLDLAYAAAQAVGFYVFISFDFNWYTTSDVSGVATMLKRYIGQPAQLLVDGKPFVSTFIGDGFDWASVANQVGRPLYAVPYWGPTQDNANNAGVSGLFSWCVFFRRPMMTTI